MSYQAHCREECPTAIEALTDDTARRRCAFPFGEPPFAELLHHAPRAARRGAMEPDSVADGGYGAAMGGSGQERRVLARRITSREP